MLPCNWVYELNNIMSLYFGGNAFRFQQTQVETVLQTTIYWILSSWTEGYYKEGFFF